MAYSGFGITGLKVVPVTISHSTTTLNRKINQDQSHAGFYIIMGDVIGDGFRNLY